MVTAPLRLAIVALGSLLIGEPVCAQALTTSQFVQVRGLSGLAVSPDGTQAIVRVDQQNIGMNTTQLHWQVVQLRDGRNSRVWDAGEPLFGANASLVAEMPQWSHDGQWIFYRALHGEQVQVWRVKPDGSNAEQLTHDAADVVAFMTDAEGALHYYARGATREEINVAEAIEYDDGTLLDPSVITGYPISASFPFNGRMATLRYPSPSAPAYGDTSLLGDRPFQVRSLDLKTRQIRPVAESVVQQLVQLWEQSSRGFRPLDPRAAAALRSADAKVARFEVRDLPQVNADHNGRANVLQWRSVNGTTPEATCEQPACLGVRLIEAIGWSGGGRELVFQTESGGTAALHVWDVERNTVRTILRSEGAFGSLSSGMAGACQLSGGEAICITSASNVPPRLVAISLRNGAQRLLFDPNPELTPERLGVAERIALRDRFGNETYGRVILPRIRERTGRLPLVITSYTCRGFLLGGSGWDVPEHVLAGLGYASVCVDTSTTGVHYVPGFKSMTLDDSALDFFEGAVRVLDERGLIDPRRVVLSGFSGSSTTTAYSLTQSNRFTAAIVTTQGSRDAILCYLNSNLRLCRGVAKRYGYELPWDSRTGMLASSPAWNVEKIRTPLLMQLPEVEYLGAMQLYSAMMDYGRGVEVYVFPESYHFKHRPRHRLAVYDRNVDWIDFWLRDRENARAQTAGQYERWRAMRESQCLMSGSEAGKVPPPWYCGR